MRTSKRIQSEEPEYIVAGLADDCYPQGMAERLYATRLRLMTRYVATDDEQVLLDALRHLECQYAILQQQSDSASLSARQEESSAALRELLDKLAAYGDSLDTILGLYRDLRDARERADDIWDDYNAALKQRKQLTADYHATNKLLQRAYGHLKNMDKETPYDRNQRLLFVTNELDSRMLKEEELPF